MTRRYLPERAPPPPRVLTLSHGVARLRLLEGDTPPGKGRLGDLRDAAVLRVTFVRLATAQGSLRLPGAGGPKASDSRAGDPVGQRARPEQRGRNAPRPEPGRPPGTCPATCPATADRQLLLHGLLRGLSLAPLGVDVVFQPEGVRGGGAGGGRAVPVALHHGPVRGGRPHVLLVVSVDDHVAVAVLAHADRVALLLVAVPLPGDGHGPPRRALPGHLRGLVILELFIRNRIFVVAADAVVVFGLPSFLFGAVKKKGEQRGCSAPERSLSPGETPRGPLWLARGQW